MEKAKSLGYLGPFLQAWEHPPPGLGAPRKMGRGCPERVDVQGSGKVWPAPQPRTGELALYKKAKRQPRYTAGERTTVPTRSVRLYLRPRKGRKRPIK